MNLEAGWGDRARGGVPADSAEPAPGDLIYRIDFRCRFGAIIWLTLGVALLTVLTLGIYRFWATTAVRERLWESTTLLRGGETRSPFLSSRLSYTGTGGELFKGFLFAYFLIFLPLSAAFTIVDQAIANDPALADLEWLGLHPVPMLSEAVWVLLIAFLIGTGTYAARRYRLSRTWWNGRHANQIGHAGHYGRMWVGMILLSVVTLGFAQPLRNTRLWNYRMNNTYFGGETFHCDAAPRPLYRPFLVAWLLAVPTLGLSFFWYKAREINYLVSQTSYARAIHLRLDVSAAELAALVIPNILIRVLTLTFGSPIADWRRARFTAARLFGVGYFDFETLSQAPDAQRGAGEGLAGTFDIGF